MPKVAPLTKTEKAWNLLKTGKKVKASTLTKRLYNVHNEKTYKNLRSLISDFRKKGVEIECVEKATYKYCK